VSETFAAGSAAMQQSARQSRSVNRHRRGDFVMLDRRLRRYLRHGMLPQLAAFEAVVRLGGFTRAAEALHLAQPTVSLLVKKLGEALGVVLFESTAPVRLTPAGQETYRFCQDFYERCSTFDQRLAQFKNSPPDTLRIVACTAAESIAPLLLDSFCSLHPEVRLVLSVANRETMLERFHARTDDFYIFGAPVALDASFHPLQEDELHFYASVAHPYARRRGLRLEALAREPILGREPGSASRTALEEVFAPLGGCSLRLEMDDDATIKRAVAAGLGVALLSRYAVAENPRHDALVPLKVEGLPLKRRWQLVHRAQDARSPVAEAFIAALTAKARQLEERYFNTPAVAGRRIPHAEVLTRAGSG